FKQFVEYLNTSGARFVVCADGTADLEEFISTFSVVEVEEPAQKVTLEILKLEARKLEHYFLTKIGPELITYVYQKAKEEIKDQVFPQKGIQLLDKACSAAAFTETRVPTSLKKLMERHSDLSAKLEQAFLDKDYDQAWRTSGALKKLETEIKMKIDTTKLQMRSLTKADVDKAVSEYKNEDEVEYKIGTKNLSDLELRLKQKIVGQDRAVAAVAKALVRAQMGLRPRNKPVGNFLFLGPTGVGKTELAKVLAQEAFGDGALIRLDMSDFAEKHTVSRLVGAPPGYVGYNEGGELTVKIARKPQSVVLFDEIEKAHPDVLNILLQIMDEGQLSDMRGDSFNFSQAVIILTSNLGTDIFHKRDIGYGGGVKSSKSTEERVMSSVKSFLKVELLNRFDELVIFNQLEQSDSVKILDLLLKEVYASLKEKGIRFKAGPKVKDCLLEKGFSREFGARALRRTIEKELLDKLAAFLLGTKGKSNGKTVLATLESGVIVVKNKK
ncbi:AAA family ATPase, partial [Patescibacteria group bacterium]|nr:AAA family ATPase [Patescibacteria group bacterium]